MSLATDLTAGRTARPTSLAALARPGAPRVLVFDSGLGGLTVLREIVRQRTDADITYVADNAAFPYGNWRENDLIERLVGLMARLIAVHGPDCIVIACNTASTLALPALRARLACTFVGTVPAIKPAAEQSRSKMISVLATPATVTRDYTRVLIRTFANGCDVTLVGAQRLAALAEAHVRGETVSDDAIAHEIMPCFIERIGDGEGGGSATRRTDTITLSCTHYPLLLERLKVLAPWPVTWIDPAPAIARRVGQLLVELPATGVPGTATARFTGTTPDAALQRMLEGFGLTATMPEPFHR